MKILNLYAGIGGNRKFWGNEHEITAVEFKPEIAKIYQDFFPNDKVVIEDAHEYLLKHFQDFDFIWSSPPCPTHSRLNNAFMGTKNPYKFPDMKLYEEIIFLKHFFKGKWVVENVISYYDPLVSPMKIADHYYWMNFLVPDMATEGIMHNGSIGQLEKRKMFDLSKYKGIDKRKTLRNCVEPEVGKHILYYALNPIKTQRELAI